MNYLAIIKKAWQITWHHKFLWWFGLFAGGVYFGFNYNFGGGGREAEFFQREELQSGLISFWQNYALLIISLGIFLFLFLIFLALLGLVAEGGLIHCVQKINEGKSTRFKEGLIRGLRKLLSLFVNNLIYFLLFAFFGLILGLPAVIFFVSERFVIAAIFVLSAFLLLIPGALLISFLRIFSFRFIVLENQKVFQSIASSWKILKSNFGKVLGLFLLSLLISFIASMIFVIFFLICLLIFGGTAFALYALHWYIVMGVFIVIAGLLFLIFLFLFSACLNTFQSAIWTLAFQELLIQPKNQKT